MSVRYFIVASFLFLAGCAVTPPFSDDMLHNVDRSLKPEQALKEAAQGKKVMWGGVIVNATNTADHTDFSILYYPLDSAQRPDKRQSPKHRFIARYPGYLETMVYAPGREITVIGELQGAEQGKIGDAPYQFPVIKASKVYLWPLEGDSRVHFGVGVGIGVHM